MNPSIKSLEEILRRVGAGCAASQQGEFLHGRLPAMEERPPTAAFTPQAATETPHAPDVLLDGPGHARAG